MFMHGQLVVYVTVVECTSWRSAFWISRRTLHDILYTGRASFMHPGYVWLAKRPTHVKVMRDGCPLCENVDEYSDPGISRVSSPHCHGYP
ncbi:hypothetical protein VTL71DRAFT_10476 [Oculimacula yallundae]|uniref:Uncharacterized protein n=1 Tax=Oculimacula yallundae TaxID=86028 RepID=A0ABR4CTN1_9HELO